MRISNLIKTHKISVVSLVLVMVAAALGVDSAFAMAEVPISSGTETATADDKGLDTQLEGTAATASHATETDFEQEEIDQAIAVFRPWNFPLEYDIVKNAISQPVKSYHPKHYRSGVNPLEAVIAADAAGGVANTGTQAVVTMTSGIENMKEYSTIFLPGISGYKGSTVDGCMVMYVIKNDGTKVTLLCLNPKMDGTSIYTDWVIPDLDGQNVIIGATAGCESQMIVDPDNYQPVAYEVYLQKKLSNIVFTDEWLEQAKKVKFIEQDIRNNALFNFKRKNARSHWLGVKAKAVVEVKEAKLGKQNVYFEEGVLRQIPMFYSYAGGKIDFADLNALSKLQFAKGAVNKTARVYCGKDYIEKLLNMDMTVNRNFKYEMSDEAGMTIHSWRNNFGTLEFVHDPTLDDIGYEDFGVCVDIKSAVRYVKRGEKVEKVDLSKGAGETHEAQREIFSIIDCICLKGYNAVLMGPADSLGMVSGLGGVTGFGTQAASLPGSPTTGDIIYLTAANGGFPAGSVVIYDGTAWKEYDGIIAA